jgi:predicted RND superfamily exporter protein
VGALYRQFVDFVCRGPRGAAVLLALLCLPPLWLTVRFFSHVEAGLQEMLPRDTPTVRALEQIHDRLGSQAHLKIIVQSADPAANRRFVTALAGRLEGRRIPEVRSIQANVKLERTWVKGRAPLLVPPAKFDLVVGSVEEAVRASEREANPLFVSVDDDKVSAQERWTRVQRLVEREMAAYDRFPNGFLETSDGQTVVAVIWLWGSEVDMGPSVHLLAAVKEEVARLRVDFPPALLVAYSGDVPNLIEEHDAILADLSLSSVLVVLLVGLLIIGYFRSPRSVLVVLTGLVPGLLATFAAGRLLVGHLNSNTAFLGSIIAGNGINYPLLLLAYYRARPPDEPLAEAIARAARQALPGTLGAAATASAAYAGLAFSNFRGFSQFGYLGGVGMVTTWAFTFLAVPVGIALFTPPRQAPARTPARWGRLFTDGRRLKVAAGGFVALTALLATVGVARGLREGIYEMHLKALRNQRSLRTGSASWDTRMTQLFGTWLNPVVVLVDRPEDREPAAAELRRTLMSGPIPAVDRIETIESYCPPAAEQARRLERLRRLSRSLHRLPPEEVPPGARPLVAEWLPAEGLTPIAEDEVPPSLLQGFHEKTHGTGQVPPAARDYRSVLIFPALAIDYEDGVNMQWLARRLGEAQLAPGAIVGGAFLFMADVFRLVHQEAPRVVLVVCVLVAILLVPLFWRRPARILLVMAAVVPAALCAQAIMLTVGVKINMLNFAAVPITIGVGADYAVNLLGAMDSLALDARRACARMGGAILLCSLTTTVGYASLLVAQSGALRTFGWAAVLGEVMAVATVLLVLPAVLPSSAPPAQQTDDRRPAETTRPRPAAVAAPAQAAPGEPS